MKNKSLFFAFILGIILSLSSFNFDQEIYIKKITPKKTNKEFNDALRKNQEFLMLRDPKTNQIPKNIKYLEQQFAAKLPKKYSTIMYKGNEINNVQSLSWTERGPNNVGGRVRALGIDIRTTGTPTILAGGVSSGLWKSTDGGATWIKKTTAGQLHSITCIAQDIRAGHQDVWYYGTGENNGNSASTDGAEYYGNGVFKSIDNGETWTQLASTMVADNTSFTSDWQYIFNIAVHPTSGSIYAATTGGVYRSADGGTSWTKTLNPGVGNTIKTDVTIASNGDVYAATSSDGGNIKGIRKSSNDGTSWTDVTPTLPDVYGRTIIKTAPSNSNVAYFFTEGVSGDNNTPNVHNHQLWRSSDGGTNWTNISTVIPANTAPALDNFSTQDGYDMLLSVKPDNDKFIIVGGVSIFKIEDVSNDEMTLAQKHIGGYGIQANGTRNAVGDFINHHPDSHIGIFKPGSNVIYYTGNDGGVVYCNDITATASGSFWQTPLRPTFNVSQFYAVSIDKSAAGSGFIAGGLQDRGNWMARTTGALQNWQEVGGGDGADTEIDPTGTYVFMSTSKGELFRFAKSDENSPVTATTDMKPAQLNNPLFINPFDLDDNNKDIMYFSGGSTGASTVSGIWRTLNATDATPTWGYFTNSNVTGEQVSAISVSKSNSSNVLYYGTSKGKMFRIDDSHNADLSSTTPTDITGAGFPFGGYINSISVDPFNSAKVLIVFSNYNIPKIWYSSNSGADWTNVTGNLTGANSPSVRWAEMFNITSVPHYFIGTSTGIYYTTSLDGGSTVWTQEATNSIGNVVVTGLDFRGSDNVLVAATHGRGVFQTTIETPVPVELISFSGIAEAKSVILTWQTATEINNYGFEILRRSAPQNDSHSELDLSGEESHWQSLSFVQGNSNSNSPKTYTFTDNTPPAGKVQYRLKQIDNDGKFEYSNIITIEVKSPINLVLDQNFPNPFNPSTTISYNLNVNSKVNLTVYDINGKQIAVLVDEFKPKGTYKVQFNAKGLSSGIYFYKLVAGENKLTRKMLILK